MLRSTVLFVLSVLYLQLAGQNANVLKFVDRYKEIAIQEMHRIGVPASIKLAQAILESEAGSSELAVNSNNFFGMKCGPGWNGETYYKKDDDYDRRGRLIKSCFRTFQTPEESFIAHSDFLLDPKKAYRYGFLFNLDQYDYQSWAWGLKESGYATNKRYAILLISLIKKYGLYSYDYYDLQPEFAMVSREAGSKPIYDHPPIEHRTIQTSQWKKQVRNGEIIDGIVTNNGLSLIYAKRGDTPHKIASRYNKSLNTILAYNERLQDRDQVLDVAERVYFQKKKKSYRGSKKRHVVQDGETMYDIAQEYGIILEKLYVRNRMYPGVEPAKGEKIQLRGMVRFKNRPKLAPDRSRQLASIAKVVDAPPANLAPDEVTYLVEHGDTLYGIANRYQVSVKSLMRRNDLETNVIKPGQILYIGS